MLFAEHFPCLSDHLLFCTSIWFSFLHSQSTDETQRLISLNLTSHIKHQINKTPNRSLYNSDGTLCDTASIPLGGRGYVGAYSPEARRERIERFLAKRDKRVWTKKVKYDVRKNFADSRLRVKVSETADLCLSLFLCWGHVVTLFQSIDACSLHLSYYHIWRIFDTKLRDTQLSVCLTIGL